jgi:hypothetical protein
VATASLAGLADYGVAKLDPRPYPGAASSGNRKYVDYSLRVLKQTDENKGAYGQRWVLESDHWLLDDCSLRPGIAKSQ